MHCDAAKSRLPAVAALHAHCGGCTDVLHQHEKQTVPTCCTNMFAQ